MGCRLVVFLSGCLNGFSFSQLSHKDNEERKRRKNMRRNEGLRVVCVKASNFFAAPGMPMYLRILRVNPQPFIKTIFVCEVRRRWIMTDVTAPNTLFSGLKYRVCPKALVTCLFSDLHFRANSSLFRKEAKVEPENIFPWSIFNEIAVLCGNSAIPDLQPYVHCSKATGDLYRDANIDSKCSWKK